MVASQRFRGDAMIVNSIKTLNEGGLILVRPHDEGYHVKCWHY
jgi:hypothetical protein